MSTQAGPERITHRPPAKLYKYQPFTERALVNLKLRRVFFAPPSSFNDPFDCAVDMTMLTPTEDELARIWGNAVAQSEGGADAITPEGLVDANGRPTEAMTALVIGSGQAVFREALDAVGGVTCFSECNDDLLLWAHYGGGHRGFCLEFDTSGDIFGKIHRVRYSDELPSFNPADLILDFDPNDVSFLAPILTKAKCWEYEREWRAIHREKGTLFNVHYKFLSAVYLGCNMDDDHKDLICHILSGSPTKIFQMQKVPGRFALHASALTYTPYDFTEDGVSLLES